MSMDKIMRRMMRPVDARGKTGIFSRGSGIQSRPRRGGPTQLSPREMQLAARNKLRGTSRTNKPS
jgi:hypothetical protein